MMLHFSFIPELAFHGPGCLRSFESSACCFYVACVIINSIYFFMISDNMSFQCNLILGSVCPGPGCRCLSESACLSWICVRHMVVGVASDCIVPVFLMYP